MLRFQAVINRDASTLKSADPERLAERLKAAFEAHGHVLTSVLRAGADMPGALEEAARAPDIDAILAAGGDGTISLAAGIAHKAGKALAVLPGGNMNFFARSLAIPLDLDLAVEALAGGRPMDVDIAFANDRPFIHEFSLGLHPEMIELRDRETFGTRLGKLVGSLRSLSRTLINPPRVRVWIDDGQGRERRIAAAALAISNNPYGAGHMPYADKVDGGVLGVYVARTVRPVELAAIAARLATGDWASMPQIEHFTTTRLRLTRRRRIKAAIDGELASMRGPVDIRIEPGALTVIAPDDSLARRGQ